MGMEPEVAELKMLRLSLGVTGMGGIRDERSEGQLRGGGFEIK